MDAPEIFYPDKNFMNDKSRAELLLGIIDSVKKTCSASSGMNIVDIWKLCLKAIHDRKIKLLVGDASILAMDAAKRLWKEMTSQTGETLTLNNE